MGYTTRHTLEFKLFKGSQMNFFAQFLRWKEARKKTLGETLSWQDVIDHHSETEWIEIEEASSLFVMPTKVYIEARFDDHHYMFPWKRLYIDGSYEYILTDGTVASHESDHPNLTWRTGTFEHIRDACVAWILCAKEMKCLVKDVQVLIARILWRTRYDVEWNVVLFARLKQEGEIHAPLDISKKDGGAG